MRFPYVIYAENISLCTTSLSSFCLHIIVIAINIQKILLINTTQLTCLVVCFRSYKLPEQTLQKEKKQSI